MAKYDLISARKAREDVQSGNAVLVCAYDSDEKFKKAGLEGAISLEEFKQQADALAKDREIIFYCS